MNISSNKKIPTGWEEKRLGDIGEAIIGLTYSPRDVVNDGGTLVLRSSNIRNNSIDLFDQVRVNIKIPDKLVIREGDILICARNGSRRLIGKNAYIESKLAGNSFGAFMSVFRTKYSDYVHYLFQSQLYKKAIARDIGPTINQVTTGNLHSFKFAFPSRFEQEEILALLETWDMYLEKLDKKIEMKKKIKKGLMQQLLTGKKRLSGFRDVWENTKLHEIAIIKKGKALSSKNIDSGPYPVIAGGQSSPYSHKDFNHENVITVSASGAYAGYVALHKGKIWASDCSVIESKKNRSSLAFIFHFLLSKQRKIYSLQSGGAQPHIYPKDLSKIKLLTPKLKEQEAIAQVLSLADEEIEALEKQREIITQQKKYLLNNLVTGQIRLPEFRN